MITIIEKKSGSQHANVKVVEDSLSAWAWIDKKCNEIGVLIDGSDEVNWMDWRYYIVKTA